MLCFCFRFIQKRHEIVQNAKLENRNIFFSSDFFFRFEFAFAKDGCRLAQFWSEPKNRKLSFVLISTPIFPHLIFHTNCPIFFSWEYKHKSLFCWKIPWFMSKCLAIWNAQFSKSFWQAVSFAKAQTSNKIMEKRHNFVRALLC